MAQSEPGSTNGAADLHASGTTTILEIRQSHVLAAGQDDQALQRHAAQRGASDSAANQAFALLMEKLDAKVDPKITARAGVRKKNPDLCKHVKPRITVERCHLETKKRGDNDCKTCQPASTVIIGSNFRPALCKNPT